jgi:hypothetical protein
VYRGLGLATLELLTYIREVLSILAEKFGKNGLPLEPFLILKDIAIHETIHHGGVGVNVNIKLQACFLLTEETVNEESGTIELALKDPDTMHVYTHTHTHTHTHQWPTPFQAGLLCQQTWQLFTM